MTRNQPDRVAEPVVQRVRLRYAKRGRLRFTSHRDFQRALERAVRRAGVPIAYSAGFTPHPRISYANAAPTGAASEAEYLEIGLTRAVDLEALRVALDGALPEGLDVLDAVEARTPDFVERLEASVWMLEVLDVPAESVCRAAEALMAQEAVEVTRMTKQGPRTFDVRAALARLVCETAPDCAILRCVIRHTTPAVRPDDVLRALTVMGLPETPTRFTRLAQGPANVDASDVGDPLAIDRV